MNGQGHWLTTYNKVSVVLLLGEGVIKRQVEERANNQDD